MVEFKTKFDENVTKAINNYQLKRLWWLYAIFTVIFAGIGVMSVLDKDYVFGGLMISFGVLFAPLVVLLTKLLQHSLNKSMNVMSDETEEVYQFEENKVTIIQVKGETFRSVTEATYDYFYQVRESKDHFFLYISRQQTHVVPKAKLTQGTLDELRIYFRNNLQQGRFISKW